MKITKIVVTGGPSGGKTTLIEAIKKELGKKVSIVPESASILYRGGFPRIKSDVGTQHAQRAIYFTQRELEGLAEDQATDNQLIVCDRGSLDAIAYWPQSSENFFKDLNTSESAELVRYDWLLHLDTAGAEYYDTSNPIRTETFLEAIALNNKIKDAWKNHPKKLVVTSHQDFLSKMQTCVKIIQKIQSHASYEEVMRTLQLAEASSPA